MKAHRAAVSTAPIGVVAASVELIGWSFLPPRAPVAGRGAGACFGCAVAGNALAAHMADASRAERRVSIGTRLLFHHDPCIRYSGAQRLVQRYVGLRHRCERPHDDTIGRGAILE